MQIVDEDLPADIAQVLRDAGHDVLTVGEQDLTGIADPALWAIVQDEGRCLVTADKGFANARVHPPGTHHGVVLLRLRRESRRAYIELARQLIERDALGLPEGAIIVVSPDSVRTYRA